MRNLNINNGIREFTINGDENKVLRVNTSDLNLAKRAKKAQKELSLIADECMNIDENMSIDESIAKLDALDTKVKNTVDYIFNSNASDIVFGEMSSVSICDGQPVFQNFLDAIIPEIEKDTQAEIKKSQRNIKKYTSQVKK